MYVLPEIIDRSSAAPLRDALLELLGSEDVIEIKASDVERITTPGFQLLVSLKIQAEEEKKQLVIIEPSAAFLDAAKGLGLKKMLNITE
jgi:anti-anti-sigma regulatory factor